MVMFDENYRRKPGNEVTVLHHRGPVRIMDDSSYRLNFDLGKKNKIHHHS
jgi:hypothetical protein